MILLPLARGEELNVKLHRMAHQHMDPVPENAQAAVSHSPLDPVRGHKCGCLKGAPGIELLKPLVVGHHLSCRTREKITCSGCVDEPR